MSSRTTSPASRHPLQELTDRLRHNARRITGPRQSVLEILRTHQRPISNKEILHEMGAANCDLATVYRSTRLLESLGVVKRCDLGDGVARYELLAEGDDGHRHHLICTRCAQVVAVEECFPEALQNQLAQRSGFTQITHRLEFFGVCASCG